MTIRNVSQIRIIFVRKKLNLFEFVGRFPDELRAKLTPAPASL